ncbi:MAG TPA: hypothetical protein DDY72_06505, partial [Verrucomicrobia bacterium]|nr:hypothetical protein [Verrucomicrobiota bacterium]
MDELYLARTSGERGVCTTGDLSDGGRDASILQEGQVTAADTIAAIATPPGKGGVAIVRVSGTAAWSVFRKLTGREPCPGRVSHGAFSWEGRILDEGLVLAFQAPRSYTGEDVVEFQCHG